MHNICHAFAFNDGDISEKPKQERAANMKVPDDVYDYRCSIKIVMMKQMLTNDNAHGFTCGKKRKGIHMCTQALSR
jgi:hypothetical protein